MSKEDWRGAPHSTAEDVAIAQAMAEARGGFKYFWRELTWEYRRIVPAFELTAIKAAFNDPTGGPDHVEHMWLSELEFDGESIAATLMSSPHRLTSLREGDAISLRLDQVEDWIYVAGGRCYGGFTIQVLRSRMTPSERQAHDEAWGFAFPDPDLVAVCAYADRELEHPVSEAMAKDLAAAIEGDRKSFLELGASGLSTLHSLALGGSAACVKVLLSAGADPRMKTKHGKTALQLAELMGWPRVAEILREAEAGRAAGDPA